MIDRRHRTSWRRLVPRRYDGVGLVPATVVASLSLTPSLLPRTWLLQGVVAGCLAVCGYALGLMARHVVRWRRGRAAPRRVSRVLGGVLAGGSAVLAVMLLSRWAGWQRDVRALTGGPEPPGWAPPAIVLVAVCLFVVLVGVGRLVRSGGRVVGRPLHRVMPSTAATAVGAAAVLLLAGGVIDRYVVGAVLAAVDRSFDTVDNGTKPSVTPPRSGLRSGGPGSLAPWAQLGVQGRSFVASAQTLPELQRAGVPGPLRQPVRVYVGLDTREDLTGLAEVAVDELVRTGGFDRAVLCVAVPTGRGWVNDRAADALERLHAGDTAIVAIQYSYLPSALEFLVDPERAKDAGTAVFDAVYARWSGLPEQQRPRLVVYGESLGSTGIQAAFSGLADLRARTDGALFVGPPQSNTLWRDLVARRDRGTPQVLPVYDGGSTVRFAARPEDLDRPQYAWNRPRVVVLQHPTDPIVWWSPRLLVQRPDWLDEPPGEGVSPWVRWYPLVTFAQLTADMAVADAGPVGHGHRYGDFGDYWAAVVPPAVPGAGAAGATP